MDKTKGEGEEEGAIVKLEACRKYGPLRYDVAGLVQGV